MVERRHHQRMLWEGWFPEEAAAWWEPWMKHADQVLDDAELLDTVYQAQKSVIENPLDRSSHLHRSPGSG